MVYLDNAATSYPKPPQVIQAISTFLTSIGASPGRSAHSQAIAASRMIFRAREMVAQLLGGDDPERVVFTLNATEAINLALFGLLKEGDRVVVSSMEHNSVMRPLRALVEQRAISVETFECDGKGGVDFVALERLLSKSPALVITVHGSNVTGAIHPIARIGALAKSAGALFMVDAAQTVGKREIDVSSESIDILTFSGHKGLMGPQGTGGVFFAEGIRPEPLVYGGTGSRSESDRQPEFLPDCYESGTPNAPGIAGMLAGVEFILETGVRTICNHGLKLRERLVDGLGTIPGIHLFGPVEQDALPIISLTVQGIDNGMLAQLLNDDYGIGTRAGLHCAPCAHKAIGTYPAGTVRLSMGWFTTEDDVDLALRALGEIAANRRSV